MEIRKLLGFSLLLMVFFSGCATIDATTSRFYAPDYKNVGTIAVVASVAEVNNSLEFSHYKPRF